MGDTVNLSSHDKQSWLRFKRRIKMIIVFLSKVNLLNIFLNVSITNQPTNNLKITVLITNFVLVNGKHDSLFLLNQCY